ncbi:hypothetical protein CEXT_804931 [Caerostris extrusa]|uniref:Uncharacterized protein n=1 Tax=Caerostris extrusa TaxID=172846 RepID=A0AAV4MDH1_CAEEX|nr:hypothetical protein CEXT_804931 [Caerostris extrusa]
MRIGMSTLFLAHGRRTTPAHHPSSPNSEMNEMLKKRKEEKTVKKKNVGCYKSHANFHLTVLSSTPVIAGTTPIAVWYFFNTAGTPKTHLWKFGIRIPKYISGSHHEFLSQSNGGIVPLNSTRSPPPPPHGSMMRIE